jgi:hypothetical protein
VRTDRYFIFSICLLCVTRLGNAILGSTPLAGWKQMVILFAFVLLFSRRRSAYVQLVLIVAGTLLIPFSIASVFNGQSVGTIAYNVWGYVSWIPFFAWATDGGFHRLTTRHRNLMVIVLAVSVVFTLIDFRTDLLSFLGNGDVDSAFYERLEIAKRASGLFDTSTVVMPVAGAMAVFGTYGSTSAIRSAFAVVALLTLAICTASLSALAVCAMVSAGITAKHLNLRGLLGLTILFTICAIVAPKVIESDEATSRQYQRLVENRDSGSEANYDRRTQWYLASHVIAGFTVEDHVFGKGMGSTNEGHNDSPTYGHGESSFVQAYIEGGMLGVAIRMLPFILFAITIFQSGMIGSVSISFYIVAVAAAVAFAPTYGAIPLQMMLGIAVGGARYIALRERRDSGSAARNTALVKISPGYVSKTIKERTAQFALYKHD